jgi:hypothetical protein
VHNGSYFATTIKVYEDRMVDCWGLMTSEEFKAKVESGWIVSSLPERAQITIGHTSLIATQCSVPFCCDPTEKADVIKDAISALDDITGKPPSQHRMVVAIRNWRQENSPTTRQALREAYQALPSWDRKFAFGSHREGPKEIQTIIASKEI